MSNLEFEPPKYARIVLEIRRRIEEQAPGYEPGVMLPTEAQLVKDFAVGRTTVVRALGILQQEGWITREHGRGSFVKGRPRSLAHASRPGLAVLDQPGDSGTTSLLMVGSSPASSPVAALLNLDAGERLVVRQWLNIHEGLPSELVTCWFPLSLAQGTDLTSEAPLPVGIRDHLRVTKDLRADHIAERLSARMPTGPEVEALNLGAGEPVLSIRATVHDAADAPRFAVEVVMPGTLHELEDVYSVPD